MSFDDDFLVGLGSGGGGKAGEDTKLSAAEVGTTLAVATAATAAAAETGAPMLAPSQRDSFGRSRRGSRGSAGSRGAGDDLLDLSNLDISGSNANGGGGGGGGDMLSASRTGTGAFSSVSISAAAGGGSQKPLATASSITDAPQFAITAAPPADPFASGPPVPILPPPRALGTPPGGKQGSSFTTAGSINSSSSVKNPSTGLAPQPPSAFFSLPGGGVGGGMGGGMNGSSSYMSSVGPSLSMSASSATGMQAPPPSSFASMGDGGSMSLSQSGGGGGGGGPGSMYGAQGGSFAQQHQQFAPSSYPPSMPGGWPQQQQQQWQQQQQQPGQPQQWQQAPPPQQGQRPASTGPHAPQSQAQAQQDNPFDAFM